MCETSPDQESTEASVDVARHRILVVEDSALVLMMIKDMFGKLDWKMVGPATRLAAALALARREPMDAALLDINLDGEMSWDVAVVLKERGIPFMFSTGYDVSNVIPEHLAGAPIIGKPFHIDELERCLREMISARGGVAESPASNLGTAGSIPPA